MTFKNYALLSTALAGLLTVSSAMAQEAASPAAPADDATEVVVTGFRKSLASALKNKKNDTRVSDGISSEDLGKFPSENIAEAIQRIPGVQMANVNGRGATISIRGLGPQYAMTTVNGQSFASADFNDGFRYDIIQTELASSIQVYKSPTADMDAGGLAGTVNIETVHPLDKKGRELVVSVKGQKSNNAKGGITPKASISYVDQFDGGKLGVFLGANYQELSDRADYLFMDRWFTSANTDGTTLYTPRRIRYRRIDRDTLRQQFNVAVQYRPVAGLELGLSAIHSKDNTRYDTIQQVFLFSQSNITTQDSDGLTALKTTQTNYTAENNRQLETRNLSSEALTGTVKWTGFDNWTLKGVLHYTQGKAYLTEEAAILGINIASSTLDMSDPNDIKFTTSNDLSDAASYDSALLTRNEYPDGAQHANISDEVAAQFDATRWIDMGILSSVSFGGKVKRDTLSRYSTRRDLDGSLSAANTPASPVSTTIVDNFLDGADTVDRTWAVPDIIAYRAALAASGIDVPTVFDPTGSYSVSRNISSVYAMANLKGDVFNVPFHGNLGIRYEDTKQLVNGYLASGSNPVNSNVSLVTGTYSTPTDYDNVLPSANFVFNLTPDLLIRAAAAKVLVRPILDTNSNLATTISTGTNSDGVTVNTIALGAATLKPLTANQFDLGIEWYYGDGNGLSLSGFLKDVKNGTYSSLVCPASFDGTALSTNSDGDCVSTTGAIYDITETKNDTSVVKIKGFEINWQQSFDHWLPVKGFGVTSNYTHVEPSSKGTSGFHLANLSENTFNATGYWENKTFSARLSANYRSAYTQTSAESFFAREGHTIRGRTLYDLTLGYNINSRLSASFGALNITNEKEEAYKDIASRWQMTSVTGSSYYISLQYKM
ncbi:TonB-dependent receptor [Asticcacaulis taihuensis]|uniref:TonB-dependent receptor n=1 Tax=Asticcacaulis taihuensis TaxID=260084 RepID=A0A1G4TG44_9CAUL|nr:TonB-dependent receptor [Asticcacaulis taihuensis]SCW80324.1 TonB-dependent receptor [Asticcacaulis taihuensis]